MAWVRFLETGKIGFLNFLESSIPLKVQIDYATVRLIFTAIDYVQLLKYLTSVLHF